MTWKTNKRTKKPYPQPNNPFGSDLNRGNSKVVDEEHSESYPCTKCGSTIDVRLLGDGIHMCEECETKFDAGEAQRQTKTVDESLVPSLETQHKIVCPNCGQMCFPQTLWHTSGSCITGVKNYD
jgi:ribosomal protein L37AE/L43A